MPHIWPLLSGFGNFRAAQGLGPSRAACGRVGSAQERFCEMFSGYRGVCEVREGILAALQVKQ